ncbi:MAG TPA: hypothetical protein VFS23_16065 [Vicinamibacterales bacterium]|nr:hypothetical protein [Vicinamibacterales bacterium]
MSTLLSRLNDRDLADAGVIPWSSPVVSFGDATKARVATLGLNPSNREFVDGEGNELDGAHRRFHTLTSLGLDSWAEAKPRHLDLIADSCRGYFAANPYDVWFKRLDRLLDDLHVSYYSSLFAACHLDLVPFATADKWTDLTRQQRQALLDGAGDVLGALVRSSDIEVLILNGSAVVQQFERVASIQLDATTMVDWTLRRQAGPDVKGVAYRGLVETIAGTRLRREVVVLGYNHNIQSSFGVTTRVMCAIRRWLGESVKGMRT